MKVYFGECLHGICGVKTHLVESQTLKPLYVGDIVIIQYVENGFVTHGIEHMTAVVNGKYTTYSDGTITEAIEDDFFIMGNAKSKNFILDTFDDITEGWMVTRIKSFEDVIDGEHWKAYGFNYKEDVL